MRPIIEYQLIGDSIPIDDVLLEELDERLGVELSIRLSFDPFCEMINRY